MGALENELKKWEKACSNGGAEKFHLDKNFTMVRFYYDSFINPEPTQVIFRMNGEEEYFTGKDLKKKYVNLANYVLKKNNI